MLLRDHTHERETIVSRARFQLADGHDVVIPGGKIQE
jgi:hypothetical protein